jgi:AcrR family transcriptional regulator
MKKVPISSKEKKTEKTEQKIIAAAVSVFQSKGYAATRTRDIAELAEINLALLNYYFRSKEKLFELILKQSMGEFIEIMTLAMNDKNTTIEKKITSIVEAYHEMLFEKPGFPLFILNELNRGNHAVILKATGLKKIYHKSIFAEQYKAAQSKGKFTSQPMIGLIMNMMSLTLFPFVAAPLLQMLGDMDKKEYYQFLNQRKEFIVKWTLQTLKS